MARSKRPRSSYGQNVFINSSLTLQARTFRITAMIPAQVIRKVRNWLANHAHGTRVPGGETILRRFHDFCSDLRSICDKLQLSQTDLDNFCDFHNCVTEWLIAKAKLNVPM